MAVQRAVGYHIDSAAGRGEFVNLTTVGSGFTVTQFRVTAKYNFSPVSGISAYTPVGVWGVALQRAATGSTPPAWNSNASDTSIMAFDNAEPVGLERIFWAPSTAAADISVSFTSTLEFRGQLLLSASTDFFAVPVDVTNAQATFKASIAWQIWYG